MIKKLKKTSYTAGMSSAASEHTESQADSKSVRSHEDVMDLVAEDDIQEEQEGNKDEVVNCICQINEENGLMIQVSLNRMFISLDE